MDTAEICRDDERRQQVRTTGDWNGLDYVEVDLEQHQLTAFFLRKAPENIRRENVRIEGGQRITGINVISIEVCHATDDDRDDCLRVRIDRPGDTSRYKLCLIDVDEHGHPIVRIDEQGQRHYQPMSHIDPRYACVEFSFVAGCPTELDCALGPECPPEELIEPEIDYLAKDYASFRQLILDRLALIMPDWKERHVPDLGITLVELLAYAGDHLSYYQDAVATEAYLDTARQRISVRRHARLVDYFLHEGCNARAWVCFETSADVTLTRDEMSLLTERNDGGSFAARILTPDDMRGIPHAAYEVFEPIGLEQIPLYEAHNTIQFYTWGDTQCCLPRGSTSAWLRDAWKDDQAVSGEASQSAPVVAPNKQSANVPDKTDQQRARNLKSLTKGNILIFEEVRDPKTGDPADANPLRRQAVRLTRADPTIDQLTNTPVVEIEWALEDALRFPLCISATTAAPDCHYYADISVAHGNVILVDHGRTLGRIDLDEKPDEDLKEVEALKAYPPCKDTPCPAEIETVARPYRAELKHGPLAYALPSDPDLSASRTIEPEPDPRRARPVIYLEGQLTDRVEWQPWAPQFDLLDSAPDQAHYAVEVDNDGLTHLRFGDGELGHAPEAGTTFRVNYRIGNGPAGNVGAEMIKFVVFRDTRYNGLALIVRNPLPALGGIAPEAVTEAKLYAPYTFRRELRRAVTAADYAIIAARDEHTRRPDRRIQRTASALRWTGSWYEALVAIDPAGQTEPADTLLATIQDKLRAYRRMGHDLNVQPAEYVPLEIDLTIGVKREYLAGHVLAAVADVLSNRRLINSRLGFFHPDQLTFGEGVSLSTLIAAVRAVEGVDDVCVNAFHRYRDKPNQEIENGLIPLGPLEVARLDNDPNRPENGVLRLKTAGGR